MMMNSFGMASQDCEAGEVAHSSLKPASRYDAGHEMEISPNVSGPLVSNRGGSMSWLTKLSKVASVRLSARSLLSYTSNPLTPESHVLSKPTMDLSGWRVSGNS